jgi:hypothetical protein
MCFVFIWEQTATCATYSINWLVFITEMKSVYCAVRTGSLTKAVCASYLKGYEKDIRNPQQYYEGYSLGVIWRRVHWYVGNRISQLHGQTFPLGSRPTFYLQLCFFRAIAWPSCAHRTTNQSSIFILLCFFSYRTLSVTNKALWTEWVDCSKQNQNDGRC